MSSMAVTIVKSLKNYHLRLGLLGYFMVLPLTVDDSFLEYPVNAEKTIRFKISEAGGEC